MDVRNTRHYRAIISPLTLLLLTLTQLEVGDTIRMEHVEIPNVVAVGESAHLVCDVDLEQGDLYSVKWYKDSDEFYDWKPWRDPTSQTYHVEGVHVDRSRSKGESVVLRSVTPATAGFYRCEASGEGPSFPSVSGGGQLMVVILPKKGPNIYGGINEDIVELNCTTDASRPAAQIRWFINNVQVSDDLVLESSVERTSSGLETSMSVLELPSHNRDYFPHSGDVLVTCEAAIAVTPSERHSPWTQTSETLATLSHHQFQRRIASEEHKAGGKIFRSKATASPSLQNLVLRKEIRLYVSCGSWTTLSAWILIASLTATYSCS